MGKGQQKRRDWEREWGRWEPNRSRIPSPLLTSRRLGCPFPPSLFPGRSGCWLRGWCWHFFDVLHQERHAVRHPLRRRRPREVVIEELEVPHREVLPVREPTQTVPFARIREQIRFLLQVAQ